MSEPMDRRKLAFVSHVPEDAAVAAELCRQLEQAGIGCWIAPRDVAPGSEYGHEILAGIAVCPAFVLLLTAGANQSMFVRHELEYAAGLGKRIFVVRAESVVRDTRLEPMLSSAVEVDLADPPRTEPRWERLVEAIAGVSDDPPAAGAALPMGGAAPRRARLAAALSGAALVLALVAVGAWTLFGSNGSDPGNAGGDVNRQSTTASPGASGPAAPVRAPTIAAGDGLAGTGPGVIDRATAETIAAMPPVVSVRSGTPADTAAPGTGEPDPALRNCPRSFALIPEQDETFACRCEESATRDGLVWGTDHYAVESKLCRAALHAGVIASTGGPVTVEWSGARELFVGTERNGVETGDERAAARSARFQGAAPPPAGPGPCPASFAMLAETVPSFSCECAPVATLGKGDVWGSDVYQDNSALCLAAVHAGAIPIDGGPITVERVGGRTALQGSERNGVPSLDAGAPARSMRFR